MTHLVLGLAILLAAGCTAGQEARRAAASPEAAVPAEPPTAIVVPVANPSTPSAGGGALHHGQLGRGPQAEAAPAVGAVKLEAMGCALASSEVESARNPPPAATRSGAARVSLVPTLGGALLTHELSHACCLKADVSVQLDGAVARVTERLQGTPCRCVCGSTLKSSLGLSRGAWTVMLELQSPGSTQKVGEYQVQVD